MPTNDERREVAARLRAIIGAYSPEDEIEVLYKACGLNIEIDWAHDYLADLIEPEPERTCGEWRGEPASYGVDDTLELWCEHCDIPLEDWSYCPNCGSKVIE